MASQDSGLIRGDGVGTRELAGPTLGVQQQRALELLTEGKSAAATAREAGIARSTLYQWMKFDAAFIAALNQWRDQMMEIGQARMLAMMERAADAVEKSLDAGDGKLGARVLEKMGVLAAPKIGPTDAAGVTKKQALETSKRAQDHFLEELIAELGVLGARTEEGAG